MKGMGPSCRAAIAGVAIALLAGCGGTQLPIGAPSVMPQSRAIIPHNERSGPSQNTSSVPDGFWPSSRLVALNGKLYGTTSIGGANNLGTVYRITTSGIENVVYSFATGCQKRKKCSDGVNPTGLVRLIGTLYGTTGGGGLGPCLNYYGPNGCGTVFSIKNGAETVLYSFTGGGCRDPRRCRDANTPNGLSAIDGTLYGTSWYGGTYGLGTVYSVTTSGVEKVLHSFGRGGLREGHGADPNSGLTDVAGTLYGTTLYSGAQGAGVVFGMSKTGRTKVLYSFDDPKDGRGTPFASGSLIDVNGVLYGTTSYGGAYHDNGTAFSITTNGTVDVVHNFGAGCPPRRRCSDGENPDAGLIDVKGVLYGETFGGGTHASGTVFSVNTSGSEKVLHSFSQAYDGPGLGLTELNGILYGTTLYGGICGGGTVFSVALNGKVKVLHSFC